MSDPDQPDRYGSEPKPPHWCETCRGHTGPDSPCYSGNDDEQPNARNWDGWDEWEAELTDFLSALSRRPDEIGQRAEGLGQFLPELRVAFARRAKTP